MISVVVARYSSYWVVSNICVFVVIVIGMQRCPYLAEMKERFWRSNNNGNENKKVTDDEGDELLKSVAMTTKTSKQSTIARLAQPEPDDPDESLPMLPPQTALQTSAPGGPSHPQSGVSTVVKVGLLITLFNPLNSKTLMPLTLIIEASRSNIG